MAYLNGERGQIILVAAFALGVIFIALAVVVNAAIFTENLATRGEATSDSDALQYRHEVEESAGRALEYVNAEYDGSGSLVTQFETNLTDISLQGARQKARLGRVVTADDVSSVVTGHRFENQTGDFRRQDGASDWIVATDLNRTREFVLNVSSISSTSFATAFTVSAQMPASGSYWNLSVYEPASGQINVTVNNTHSYVASCERSVSGNVEIDLTSGTIEGEPCHALQLSDGNEMWFASGLGSGYEIRFTNAGVVTGGYSGVVNATAGTPDPVVATANPTDAIYSLAVRYTYQTPSLYYETDIRVAPGEPDG